MSKKFYPVTGSLIILLALFTLYSCRVWAGKGGGHMGLTIESKAFKDGEYIPERYTCDGADISPHIIWSGAPSGTKSFVVIVDDPDAPMGTFNHWVIYDIPASVNELAENIPRVSTLPDGAKQGVNSFRRIGYGGPCPPPGPAHRYYFYLYALDIPATGLGPGATKRDVERKIQGHILEKAETMGRYGR